MSVASQCSECCTCPTATVEWDSRSASKTKAGFWYAATPTIFYLRTTPPLLTFEFIATGGLARYSEITYSGSTTYDPNASPGSEVIPGEYSFSQEGFPFSACGSAFDPTRNISNGPFGPAFGYSVVNPEQPSVASFCSGSGPQDVTLSDEYTTALLKSNTVAALPAYDDDWDDTAGSFANTSTDETSYAARESRYRLRFKIPKTNTGKNYRVSWVERFIAEAGVAVSSVEVYARGVYRPTVTISTSPLGTNAAATAVMASDGTVASISILNPGAGYIPLITFSGGGGTGAAAYAVINSSGAVTSVVVTSAGSGYSSAPTVSFTSVTAPRVRATGTASISGGIVTSVSVGTAGDFRPTVTVQAATGGGTSSTGWIATLTTTGQVSSIASGSAGDYRPTLAFTGGGGSGATATCTVDSTGGITAVTVSAGGSAYTSEPTLTITPKVTGSTAADLLIHMGTETAKCAAWDGTTLGGKWVKREVVDAGHALASIEVLHGGNYLPTVTIGGPGTGATATVTGFSADGKVTAISVGAGGTGYTSAPTVTITGRNGGSGATATATVSGGAVTGIAVVNQGNYLPTLSITGGSGAGATATVALNSSGAISGVTLTAAGSGFKTNPTLTLSYYGTETILLAAHFGTETEYADNAQLAGTTPLGYVDNVVRTYPLIGNSGTAPWKYYELDVPSSDGTTVVANIRTVCDGTSCP